MDLPPTASPNDLSDLARPGPGPGDFQYRILLLICLAHFLNDATQSLLAPTYPLFKDRFGLSFTQIGVITLVYNITASLLQPLVGRITDRHPWPYLLPVGMCLTMSGLLMLSQASSYYWILASASILGSGSSVFHPEGSRVARQASGGLYGSAQSIFQVGGNAGFSVGPLLAAAVIIANGQGSMAWFFFLPLAGIAVLTRVSLWAAKFGRSAASASAARKTRAVAPPRRVVVRAMAVLLALIFSKYFYTASITSYFIFYLTSRFGLDPRAAQIRLFVYLLAMAIGTIMGGPIGDRIGRKKVIWASILGIAPLTLALPQLDLFWTTATIFLVGLVLASAFPAIVVFAQEMLPGRVGTVAGLFFGLSFGMGGIAAAVLGRLADIYGIEFVYRLCSFLPLIGLLTVFLPDLEGKKGRVG
ncbi:MAG: MFS transporter [Planctomycetota bacterium]|jgi:FSR family fosmidomycin resistance protein-like MFS transporter|nr:MFS transporter [Planctomycetota bacterium]